MTRLTSLFWWFHALCCCSIAVTQVYRFYITNSTVNNISLFGYISNMYVHIRIPYCYWLVPRIFTIIMLPTIFSVLHEHTAVWANNPAFYVSPGSITRHDMDTPPVSDRMISIYKYEDIFMPATAYQTFSSPFCLLLIVALTFYLLMGSP